MKNRSSEKELLDDSLIPQEDLYQNLRELEFINRHLGGHQLNQKAFSKLLPYLGNEALEVVELASGGGDNLRDLAKFCRKQGIVAHFTGVDLKPECTSFAIEQSVQFPEITYVCSDYRDFIPKTKVDIAFSSLFCHHLSDEEIMEYLYWNQANAKTFFVNDLHRNKLAEKSILLLTQLFSKSYLVKNDAPASVRRAFRYSDWESYLIKSGVKAKIEWKWAFRWMLLVENTDAG